jgi:hypothetical protein
MGDDDKGSDERTDTTPAPSEDDPEEPDSEATPPK